MPTDSGALGAWYPVNCDMSNPLTCALRRNKPFREHLCALLEPHDMLVLHDAFPGLALLSDAQRDPLARTFLRDYALRRHHSASLYRYGVTRGAGYRGGLTRASRVLHACEAAPYPIFTLAHAVPKTSSTPSPFMAPCER